MAAQFLKGLRKTAIDWKAWKKAKPGMMHDSSALDRHGLKMLAIAPAVHAYKAVKDKDTKEGVMAASELGGLAMLHRAVKLSHK
jgi:hypothetical protein